MLINRSSSKAELVQYAKETHGVDVSALTKDAILSKLSDMEGKDYANMAEPNASVKSSAHAKLRKQKKIKIMIPSTEAPDGKDDVQVGVNGVLYLIKRDLEVEVPESVVGVLKNAVQTLYLQNEETGEMAARRVPSYPFSIVG